MADDIEKSFYDDLSVDNLTSMLDMLESSIEEKEERKKRYSEELLKEGFLPVSDDYAEEMQVSQEMVEKNPTRFIITECIPACKQLWAKNIYTFMVSDYLDKDICWIEIKTDALSDENKDIYMQLAGDGITKFSYHDGALNFGVKCVGLEAQDKLLTLAKKFKMQDVTENCGYISIKTFLIKYCDCFDEIDNPEYVFLTPPWKMNLPLEQQGDYLLKYDEWENSIKSKKTIKKFNPNKINDSLENLVKKHNMILEGDRIYLSPFHYQKHINYIKYVESKQNNAHK